jgi:hypothetical protein
MADRITYIRLDVHKESIVVAVAEGGLRGEVREYSRIANTATALDRLMRKLGDDGVRLRFCYEAGRAARGSNVARRSRPPMRPPCSSPQIATQSGDLVGAIAPLRHRSRSRSVSTWSWSDLQPSITYSAPMRGLRRPVQDRRDGSRRWLTPCQWSMPKWLASTRTDRKRIKPRAGVHLQIDPFARLLYNLEVGSVRIATPKWVRDLHLGIYGETMDDASKGSAAPSRRSILRKFAFSADGAAILATGVAGRRMAEAQTKATQKAVGYQDTPHGAQRCDNCRQFEPPSSRARLHRAAGARST